MERDAPAVTTQPSVPDAWEKAWASPWDQKPSPPAELPLIKADTPAPLEKVYARHSAWIDSVALQFEDELRPVVDQAQKQLAAYLRATLTVKNGIVEQTPANLAILRQIDALFMQYLDAAGYQGVLDRYTSRFGEQIPFLQDTINFLAQQSGHSLPAVSFTADQLDLMGALEITSQASIRTAMRAVAGLAMQKIMFSAGGSSFADLVSVFEQEFGGSLARNRQRAETASSVYYRTITDLQYRLIEKEIPGLSQSYVYSGPLDKITRPFCRHMLAVTAKRSLTRAEIDKLDNGQLPNVFQTGGGYGCRHQWLLSLTKKSTAQAA